MNDTKSPDTDESAPSILDRLTAERSIAFERGLSSVSHAVATPLQVIAGRASLIASDTAEPRVLEHVQIIERKVRELSDLLRALLEFARGADDAVQVDLRRVVDRELTLVRAAAPAVSFRTSATDDAIVIASSELVQVAVAGIFQELVVAAKPETSIESRVYRDGARVCWRLGTPTPFASAWASGSHETWMTALDRRGPERERALRQGIVLGALKRLSATHSVYQDADSKRWILEIAFTGRA